MRIRNLAVTATLIPVLMLAGCGDNESADVAASSPAPTRPSSLVSPKRSPTAPSRQSTRRPRTTR